MLVESILSSIRDKDQSAFRGYLNSIEPNQLNQKLSIRYTNWFSGIGTTLLQLTSFVRPEFSKHLLERGAVLDLHSACALGDFPSVQQVLKEQPESIHKTIDTYYPVQFALSHPPIVQLLLDNGVDPNQKIRKMAWFEWEDHATKAEISDWTLMHMVALGRGSNPPTETASVLYQGGADLKATSSPFGNTPIHLSAIYNRPELIRWFVEMGCEVDSRSTDINKNSAVFQLFDTDPFSPFFETHTKTPLMLAAGEGQFEAVQTLLDLGADVHVTDSAGFTPLHYACGAFWGEHVDILMLLLKHGSSPQLRSKEGIKPLDLAIKRDYEEIQKVLTS